MFLLFVIRRENNIFVYGVNIVCEINIMVILYVRRVKFKNIIVGNVFGVEVTEFFLWIWFL